MTSLLAIVQTLLREDGVATTVSWQEIVVHANRAPVPSPGTSLLWGLGFDFVVLSPGGDIAWFGRCRSPKDDRQRRATELRVRLSQEPALASVVPHTRSHVDEHLLVELGRFVAGDRVTAGLERANTPAFAAETTRILDATRLITATAQERVAELKGARAIDVAAVAAPSLARLEAMGLTRENADALRRAMAGAGTLPDRVQHGDLWFANVLRNGSDYVVLDYEELGAVRVPLYDALHFLRTALLLRRKEADTLLGVLQGSSEDADAARAIVRAECARDGLGPAQAWGALAFYLADITAKLRGRETLEVYWRPYWKDLEALAERLRAGDTAPELLLGQTVSSA